MRTMLQVGLRKGEDGGRIVEEGGDEVAVDDVTRIQT